MPSAIDTYLQSASPDHQAALEKLRQFIHATVPQAEEMISYGMPAFKYKGQPLIYFGAFKDHMSLFPTSGPIEAFKDRLAGFTISKGTIQFTVDKPIPDDLIKDMLEERIASIDNSKEAQA